MYKQLSITDLIKSVKKLIDTNTELHCYDIPPDNQPAPLVYVQLVGLDTADTKTLYCKEYTLWLHVIDDETKSHVPLYRHIEEVQEAMTDDLDLASCFSVVAATDKGINTIKKDESGEMHAVLEYSYKIAYGMQIK